MSEAEPTRETHSPLGETGRRLREARKAKHQSVSEVAECLHLRPSIVSAIEDGDYRQIPGELFLRGYVKSYARYLGLDEESTIEILDRELEPLREEDERARIEHPLEEIQRRKEQRRRTGRWLALALVIVVAVIAYVAFTQFGGSFRHKPGAASSSGTPSSSLGTPSSSTKDQTNGAASGPAATGAKAQSKTALTAAGGTSAASQSGATAPSKRSIAPGSKAQKSGATAAATGTPTATTTVTSGSGPAQESAKSAQKAGAAPAATQPQAQQNTSGQYVGAELTATFGGDCWVEVKNGDGVEVVAALKRAGDKMYYRGPPPFHVVLGAVSHVTQMTYKGKPVDLKQYPSPGNRAEFVLGKKKD